LVNFPGPTTNVFCTYPATAAVGMSKSSLATTSTVRIAQDDDFIFFQELLLNGTSEAAGWGTSDIVGIG